MVYIFMSDGTEEIEAITVFDLLKRGGADVKTVGVPKKEICLSHGLRVGCDLSCEEIILDDSLEAVVLPGGMPGTRNLEQDENVQRAIDFAAARGLLLCAICAAPSILGHKGLLSGKNAVCYPGFEKELRGAVVGSQPAVRDGSVVTANGAGSAIEFAACILAALKGADASKTVLDAIQYRK